MAVRYAGDVEIRIRWQQSRYHVSFRSTTMATRGKGTLSPRECGLSQKRGEDLTSPEAYDKVAERVLGYLRLKGIRTGELRRVFQAPCPIPIRRGT